MNDLIVKVEQWAINKGIDKPEFSFKQMAKVTEEIGEVAKALCRDDKEELIDAIGDSAVTLIILALQNDLNFEECLETAYNVIKDRKGKTENGVFIKDEA